MGETLQLFSVLYGLWSFYLVRAELQTARKLAEQLLSFAQSAHDPALLVEARLALGLMLLSWESLPLPRHTGAGLMPLDPQQHRSHAFRYGHDPGIVLSRPLQRGRCGILAIRTKP